MPSAPVPRVGCGSGVVHTSNPRLWVPSVVLAPDEIDAMQSAERRILVLKTGYSETLDRHDAGRVVSLGDVLRATPLLHLFRDDHVTWVTDASAVPLLRGIEHIDVLIGFGSESMEALGLEQYDLVINLEKDPELCALAESVQARRRCGFTVTVGGEEESSAGVVAACRDRAALECNGKPLQDLLFETVGADWAGEEYILGYDASSTAAYDVALNTDVGSKLPTKKWPSVHWDDLESRLSDARYTVTRQDKQSPPVHTQIPRYVDWLNSASLVVTADTLGLHVALALKKPVVALFGPTPSHEVHLYGRGVALLPDPWPECAPCRSSQCLAERHCMDDIRTEVVFRQVERLLHTSHRPNGPTP